MQAGARKAGSHLVLHVDVAGREEGMDTREARALRNVCVVSRGRAPSAGNADSSTWTARAQVSMSCLVARARPQMIGGLGPVPTVSAMCCTARR